MIDGRVFLKVVALVLWFSFGLWGTASAQYPSKPVRLISPFPPGGGVDAIARIVANALSEDLGQAIIVENHGGAGGRIGTEIAAKSAPDGYTLLLGSVGPNAIIPSAYQNLPYDAINSFSPVSVVGRSAYALTVPANSPAKNVNDLIALAKARPGALDFASTGNLGGPHLAGELFKNLASIKAVHVPYKGGGPMITALLSGEVSFAFVSLPTVVPHMKAGTLRVLAITATERSSTMPDVPTVAEFLPGYEVLQWYGILAPAQTPLTIVTKLHDEIVKVVNLPKVRAQLASSDTDPFTNSPGAFQAQIKNELSKYRTLIEKAAIRIE